MLKLTSTNNSKDCEYVYELFSIVVHSGTPRAGHYYSNIKNFEDGKWYRFDDSQIYDLENFEIAQNFGDGYSFSNNNSPTGYILMYRKVESFKVNFDKCLIQNWLLEYLEQQNELIKAEEQKQIERMNTLQLKFIYNDKIINIFEKKQSKIKDLKAQVITLYSLDNTKSENIRIRNVHNSNYKLMESFDDENKVIIN